ncbi:MAG: AMP-binding protein [Polyangiaceae bacterium]
MPFDSILHHLFRQASLRPTAPAYFEKREGRWQAASYRRYADQVRQAARALIALDFKPGQAAAILGFNRSEWVIADLGAMAAGGVPAGIYTTCSPEEVQYIIDHSGAPIVFVENLSQWSKVERELHRLPNLRHVVLMRGAPKVDHPMVLSWEEFLAKAEGVDPKRVDERVEQLEPAGLATFIYTSGTTGPPKAVMLSHRGLVWTAETAVKTMKVTHEDYGLSYLPLSHVAEQMLSIHVVIAAGCSVYFAESLDRLADNLKEVQPTVFFGVPRVWEKFFTGIRGKLAEAKGAKKKIADAARAVGRQRSAYLNRGEQPPPHLRAAHELFNRLVYSKLKEAIGLKNARVCVSGAAPIAREVLEFFSEFDLRILEVYGQSEDNGPTSINLPGKTRFGTVGPAFPGVEVKIADDGEIIVRGPNVFLGYYKDEAATNETLIDGWLHSGDLGEFSPDGFLSITGRKKEILITSGGKNIAPRNIEEGIKGCPLVGEAVVIGDRRKYLTALITLEPEACAKLMSEKGLSGPAHECKEIRDIIQARVDEVNSSLARVETVKKFTLLHKPFSLETGELTPTLKIRRKVVNQRYASEIEAMYGNEDA